ncbi:hypothetical protein GLOIN_2v1770870 [Rhizophagus irregularis DAOM 181602=DAOM 197198]|uniref:Uncharacterized protein n=1 Tax=Rhizophagus irregularis (strain DAOM 181602 / DAOM 197198 / MUCL 43194) TaxID=747089 RepID=A0A2P4QB02_RHIID|nr:hypothetical protein GLOIN_2v1770870 [Rhizophagus irregularis DAOM 181602=DAOM 197198]POG74820.1 hypothetical protein GLOIN_2v1770870 [Rhizophagus irregularis DAOM 181602=DAOM 197198]GET53879.1 hypothetical protein GLOIN_2v1770870 [Rhizophagus irregularis DAOM 181602=DAOM 197198]|eukprot:XP_025181686.1 hypothetical protein GLOIN_2v1770870 [Rhizophagus irregularis DAOM 181602=DAOM 197198]
MELEFQMGRKGHLLNIEPGFQTGTEDYKDTIRLYGNVTFRLYDTNLNIAEIT